MMVLKHALVPAWDVGGKVLCCSEFGTYYMEKGYPVDLRAGSLTCIACIAALQRRDYVFAYAVTSG